MPRFFVRETCAAPGEIFLDSGETRHAVSVFRVKKGDPLELFDGRGRRFLGVATDVRDGRLGVRVTGAAASRFPSPAQVSLAVGVFRPERMEILVQKACELGAHAILPVLTQRSIVRLSDERWRAKIGRWQKIVRESCKQCGLSYGPELAPPRPLENFIPEIKNYDLALISTLEGPVAPLAASLPSAPPRRILVLIGPEGDFTPGEVARAVEERAKPVSLGPLVLRSETAGIYALSVIHFFYREVGNAKKPTD